MATQHSSRVTPGGRTARLLVLLGLIITACSMPVPSSAPSGAPRASPSPTATLVPLAHFEDDFFAFDYPAGWRIIQSNLEVRHYQWFAVILGTGEWALNCATKPPSTAYVGGISCGADIVTVDPGEVVVQVYVWTGPSVFKVATPANATQLPGGIPATNLGGFETSRWTLYPPSWVHPLVIDARFPRPEADRFREEVRRAVESIFVLKAM